MLKLFSIYQINQTAIPAMPTLSATSIPLTGTSVEKLMTVPQTMLTAAVKSWCGI